MDTVLFPWGQTDGTFSCCSVNTFLLTIWYRTKILSLPLWKISSRDHCSLRFSFIKLMWENPSCNVHIGQEPSFHAILYFFLYSFLSSVWCSVRSCTVCTIILSVLRSFHLPRCNLYSHSVIGVITLCESSRNHIKIFVWQTVPSVIIRVSYDSTFPVEWQFTSSFILTSVYMILPHCVLVQAANLLQILL